MSYVKAPPRRYRARTGKVFYSGMGDTSCPDWMPSIFCAASQSSGTACVAKANETPQVKAIDAEVLRLAGQWKPTGYVTPAELKSLLDVLASEAEAAGAAVASAPAYVEDAKALARQAISELQRKYQGPALSYQNAYNEAVRTGARAIDAPGVKDWVIASMQAISMAYVTAYALSCIRGTIVSILGTAYSAAVRIGAVAWRVVGVVVKAGESIIKAAETTATMLKYLPYAAIGIAAYLFYQHTR